MVSTVISRYQYHDNRSIRNVHIIHNVVDRDVLEAMWEEFAGLIVHRDQLSAPPLSENALLVRRMGVVRHLRGGQIAVASQ